MPEAADVGLEALYAEALEINEDDGTSRGANIGVPGDGTDEEPVADALVACLRAAAAMRGAGLVAAVERRLR